MTALLRDQGNEPFRLSKTRLSELWNSTANSRTYRFVYLRQLKKAINKQGVYGEVRCFDAPSARTQGAGYIDYSVHVDSSSKILNIGCKQFRGSAYHKIMRAARAA